MKDELDLHPRPLIRGMFLCLNWEISLEWIVSCLSVSDLWAWLWNQTQWGILPLCWHLLEEDPPCHWLITELSIVWLCWNLYTRMKCLGGLSVFINAEHFHYLFILGSYYQASKWTFQKPVIGICIPNLSTSEIRVLPQGRWAFCGLPSRRNNVPISELCGALRGSEGEAVAHL